MLEKIVAFCLRWPWAIVLLTLALSGAGGYLTVEKFAIDTDTVNLFSSSLPWRQNENKLYKTFPETVDLIVAVIDAETPEKADTAAKELTNALSGQPLMSRVWQPDDNSFFRKNGLLYLSQADVEHHIGMLIGKADVLQPLAEDPSLRGLSAVMIDNQKRSAPSARATAMYLAGLNEFSRAFEETLKGETTKVDWEKLLAGGSNKSEPQTDNPLNQKRRLVLIKPVIDFSALAPGAEAIDLVRKTAATLKLTKENGVNLRLTGQVPLADDEFSTLSENMALNTSVTLGLVTLILFLALRSPKLIIAVLITLIVGLVLTAGAGVLLIGRFNLISVAFAALFIGLGVDFGIQFATRYREERHSDNDLERALLAATRNIGGSLTLAAVSLLAGFFCFLPTSFLGVSELGLIAGVGMIIAYVATLTFLPAMIKLLHPRPEHVPIYTASLAAVDHWILEHRKLVLAGTAVVVAAGLPFLMHLSFDSNPMNLRDQKIESVATFLDLSQDPQTAPNKIEVLTPSIDEARILAKKIAALPEVDHVHSIDTLIPTDQDAKLALIDRAKTALKGALEPSKKSPPSDAETVKALTNASKVLQRAAGKTPDPSLTRFTTTLDALAAATPAIRAKAADAAFSNFQKLMSDLKQALGAAEITPESLAPDLRAEWISSDGLVRLEVTPKGDSNDRLVMTKFAEAVQVVAPNASGPPVIVSEAGRSITRAFLEAGLYALIAIFIILAVALRNPLDVALTLGPLVLAGIMSLEAADMAGMSLNFANVIALPLMFGVGVAFHIYYVIAWRKGVVDMLASSLTRAIFFSSLTTGVAFGSLYLSSHPGTASMGELLIISLFFTLLAAFIIVPAFLGPPRQNGDQGSEGSKAL
ncbi:MAG: hopanoid biosynthesis-associated RND transporter HpnN [Methylocystaceae bacterium]|nr:hopanoid biosynthesis-associated RND transporter HpnN [Methylocystaceae bacterium]NBT96898.1 hopanoid biosynthesis-associated RND transporter HpnN [Methylocystaceae bacterium]